MWTHCRTPLLPDPESAVDSVLYVGRALGGTQSVDYWGFPWSVI